MLQWNWHVTLNKYPTFLFINRKEEISVSFWSEQV